MGQATLPPRVSACLCDKKGKKKEFWAPSSVRIKNDCKTTNHSATSSCRIWREVTEVPSNKEFLSTFCKVTSCPIMLRLGFFTLLQEKKPRRSEKEPKFVTDRQDISFLVVNTLVTGGQEFVIWRRGANEATQATCGLHYSFRQKMWISSDGKSPTRSMEWLRPKTWPVESFRHESRSMESFRQGLCYIFLEVWKHSDSHLIAKAISMIGYCW